MNLYCGQIVYLDIPDSECVGRIRGWSTDYGNTMYSVMWNDGTDGSYYEQEITTKKPVPLPKE